MVLKILTEKEIEGIYSHDMQRDFPKAEIKPLKTIMELRKQGHYQCYGGFEDGELCAYLFLVWEQNYLALLDYFAVLPKFRGQGKGSELLSLIGLTMEQEGFLGILFEIEQTALAENREQEAIRTRRKHFYLRAGCKESGLKSEIFGVGYEILYLLLKKKQVNCGKQEIESSYMEIYHRMVKKEYYDENVKIHID